MKDRIKEIRKAYNLTQVQFGERIGIKGNTVTNYESGSREPSNAVIASICREFNINENWLLTGNGEMKKQLTEDEELTSLFGKLLSEDDSESLARVKKAFIAEMLRLEPAAWEKILEIAKAISEKEQKETE